MKKRGDPVSIHLRGSWPLGQGSECFLGKTEKKEEGGKMFRWQDSRTFFVWRSSRRRRR